MPAMNNRLSKVAALMSMVWLLVTPAAMAHPMPDTEITIDRQAGALHLTIHVSIADLRLVLGADLGSGEDLTASEQDSLSAYFAEHTSLSAEDGQDIPISVDSIRLVQEDDQDVGHFAEVEVILSAPAEGDQAMTLDYDGVLHQVANHRAIVSTASGEPVGIIRYDLATKRATSLDLTSP